MSYDLNATNSACDHLIILERYVLDGYDCRTLRYAGDTSICMRGPINGSAMLRLFIAGQVVSPNHPLYGYDLVPDPQRIQEEGIPYQKIVFRRPVRLGAALIQVTYFTRQGQCVKCGAVGRVVDWKVSPDGTLTFTTGTAKLAQQALKFLLCSKNPFSPSLVCPVRSYLNRKYGAGDVSSDIEAAVQVAMATYQNIQRVQATVQTMVPTEMIEDVLGVNVVQDESDPTRIYVSVSLKAFGSKEAIPINAALQTV